MDGGEEGEFECEADVGEVRGMMKEPCIAAYIKWLGDCKSSPSATLLRISRRREKWRHRDTLTHCFSEKLAYAHRVVLVIVL